MMTNADFSFYTSLEYFVELKEIIDGTKKNDRVVVVTMPFAPHEPPIGAVVDALIRAAERGVKANLIIDAYTFLINDKYRFPGPLWYGKKPSTALGEPFKTRMQLLEKLAQAGGQYTITNIPDRPFKLPQAGRSHLKGAVVGDTVFLGACNLTGPHDINIMTSFVDQDSADWYYDLLMEVVRTNQTKIAFHGTDVTHVIDPQTTLMLDAGNPGQSIIYDTALQLIDAAKEWIFLTCQYIPHGTTAQHLLAAYRRGVQVELLFNKPYKHGPIEGTLELAAELRERLRLPRALFEKQLPMQEHFLHGKLLATESAALYGSHNYVSTGTRLGTAEIACLRKDAAFARQSAQFITKQLGTYAK